jgi:hypothetical protein
MAIRTDGEDVLTYIAILAQYDATVNRIEKFI